MFIDYLLAFLILISFIMVERVIKKMCFFYLKVRKHHLKTEINIEMDEKAVELTCQETNNY